MRERLRVIQVGVGGFGGYRRVRMRETGLFELLAAYDLNPAALAAAEREDGARPAASFEALLDTPGAEALIVYTGAKFHAEQALAAMDRGLHVFIEKPLCATPGEMETLLAKQRDTGRVVGLGHLDHSHEAVSRQIKEMIDRGDLGAVAAFEETTCHSGGLHIKPGDWRGDPERNPGGMLFQCGVHGIHELMYYFGPIASVFCAMRYDVNPATGTADVACCHLKFASGLVGTLNAYHVSPYRHTLNIFGTRANIYRDNRYFDEGTELRIQRVKPGEKEPKERVDVDETQTDICGNVRSFHQAVRHGGQPYPSLLDGARAVAVVFAAEESARTERPVHVTTLR